MQILDQLFIASSSTDKIHCITRIFPSKLPDINNLSRMGRNLQLNVTQILMAFYPKLINDLSRQLHTDVKQHEPRPTVSDIGTSRAQCCFPIATDQNHHSGDELSQCDQVIPLPNPCRWKEIIFNGIKCHHEVQKEQEG